MGDVSGFVSSLLEDMLAPITQTSTNTLKPTSLSQKPVIETVTPQAPLPTSYNLNLSPNFMPDVDLLISEGIAAFGIKGAGKSNACGRLLEQLSRFPMPYIVPDTKGEYISLKDVPHATTFVIATVDNMPSAKDILEKRLQVVMDLRTWESDEMAARAMTRILSDLFAHASSLNTSECVPCPCILDEAQYWLPQGRVSYLTRDTAHALRESWNVLATRARSLGLVPSYFTQNISELHKTVVRQCGVYILMRQVLDRDLDRYCEYVRSKKTNQVLKNVIRAFPTGKAIVVLPGCEQITTTFHPRESTHTSNTPSVRALVKRLAAKLGN
jgi:hypothetical protein